MPEALTYRRSIPAGYVRIPDPNIPGLYTYGPPPGAPAPSSSYSNISSQYAQFFNAYGKYFNTEDLDKAQAALQQSINAGVDPSVLTERLAALRKSAEYQQTRQAQGWDAKASEAVASNFGQQATALSRVGEAAQRASTSGIPQAQIAGVIQGVAANDPLAQQALEESLARQSQLTQQNKQLEDFRTQLSTQYFGTPNATLEQALASQTGDIGQLNTFLGKQASDVFNRELKPQILNALGARGLLDSGATSELLSRELGKLERSRQASSMEAALGARGMVQGLQREDIMGDVGARQQGLNEAFGLQRQSITMNFQRELEQERNNLMRELSARRGGGGGQGGALGMGLGTVLGGALGAFGGPAGAMMGASLGGALGGGIGNFMSPSSGYSSLAGIPQTFAQGSGFFANTQSTPRTGTVNRGKRGGWETYPYDY